MKNRRKDIEPLEKRVVAALKDSYELGYSDGIEDGNICTHTFEKKVQQAYNNGLNDAWECARTILHMEQQEINKMMGGSDFGDINIIDELSVSEAMHKVNEYEEHQKQDPKEKIKVGDEVMNGGVSGVVVHIREIENGMKAFTIIDKKGMVWNFNDLIPIRTGRHFPQITEILKLL